MMWRAAASVVVAACLRFSRLEVEAEGDGEPGGEGRVCEAARRRDSTCARVDRVMRG